MLVFTARFEGSFLLDQAGHIIITFSSIDTQVLESAGPIRYIHSYVCICVCIYIYIYNMYIYIYIHTYIHIYIQREIHT